MKPLWRNVSFTLMWTSTAASGFGDRMIMLASLALLGGWVGTQNSSSVHAATQFWFFLPYILCSVPAGWIADHLPRKWLLLACDEARGIILLLAFFLVAQVTGPANLPVNEHRSVMAVLFAIGIFAALFNTTRNAIIPQIVDVAQLQPGNAIIHGINMIASLIGIQVGAQIILPQYAGSVRTGLLVAAIFYFVSGTFYAFMRVRGDKFTPLFQAATNRGVQGAGRYVWTHKRIVALIALNLLIWTSAAVVSTAILGIGKVNFGLQSHALEVYFASTYAALGAGMLVGAIAIGLLRIRRESLIVAFLAMIGAGLCVLLLAIVPIRPLSYLFAFGIGFLGDMVVVTIMTLIQSMAPNRIRGRVMGINAMAISIFSVSAYLAMWRLPDADVNLLYVMYGLGPLLMIVGAAALVRYIISGPFTPFLNLLWRLLRLFTLVWHRLEWEGRHHIPRSGPVILASNHTTGLDPMLIQAGCPRKVRWVMLAAFRFRIFEPIWRAVEPIFLDMDRRDTGKVRAVIRELDKGELVGLFPEGGLQRTERVLQPFQPGLAVIAKRTQAMILPVWISGTPRRRNIIVQLLQPSHSKIIYGKPYKPCAHDSPEQIMAELRGRLLALAGNDEVEDGANEKSRT